MRSKEGEADYGYIIEPDLPVFEIDPSWMRKVQESIPELGPKRAARWVSEWKIDETDARIIADDLEVAIVFEDVAKAINPVLAARWVRREVLRHLNDAKKTLKETALGTPELTELLKLVEEKQITDRIAQKILADLFERKFSPIAEVESQGLGRVADEDTLKKICEEVIAEQTKAVEDYNKGEEKALQFLIGQAMRKTKGTAAPDIIKGVLKQLLN